MAETHEDWFETLDVPKGRVRRVSKFLRKEFTVRREVVEERWHVWTRDERLKFAGAFSARAELSDDDQSVLDFLMDNGDPEIWCTIALSVARHRDRDRSINFLLTRIKEGVGPLANYYQALEMVPATEYVPDLQAALREHHRQVELHPFLKTWGDRFFYLDFLSCSATLFKITGQEEYRVNLKRMLRHEDEAIRRMVRMVAASASIPLS